MLETEGQVSTDKSEMRKDILKAGKRKIRNMEAERFKIYVGNISYVGLEWWLRVNSQSVSMRVHWF